MTTITLDVDLTRIVCGECGGVYAITERYRQQKYDKGQSWTCPYCRCSWGYSGSEIERLKGQLARQRAAHDQTRAELRETEARRRAEKAAKTKLKKRIAAGVCPCCKRSFQNLGRHMTTQHPEFATSS